MIWSEAGLPLRLARVRLLRLAIHLIPFYLIQSLAKLCSSRFDSLRMPLDFLHNSDHVLRWFNTTTTCCYRYRSGRI
jgi:hypothetical protein